MKIHITILLLFYFGCSKSQSGFLGGNITPPREILLFSGESNAGGNGQNSLASVAEKAVRTSIILNNETLLFERLHVGVNNGLGHFGYGAGSTLYHGWELQMANQVDSGTFRPTPFYLVKTGQGGSTIAQWGVGTGYWDSLQKRLDTAIVLMKAINHTTTIPDIYLFYSHGINDRIAGTPVATWKAATIAHFAKIRVKYGQVPIFITYLPVLNNEAYNTAITELDSEVLECYAIQTDDATLYDANHWNYEGVKLIARRMITALLANYDL